MTHWCVQAHPMSMINYPIVGVVRVTWMLFHIVGIPLYFLNIWKYDRNLKLYTVMMECYYVLFRVVAMCFSMPVFWMKLPPVLEGEKTTGVYSLWKVCVDENGVEYYSAFILCPFTVMSLMSILPLSLKIIWNTDMFWCLFSGDPGYPVAASIFSVHNFAKCFPISKILSPLDSAINLQ